jgi:2-desacetyl-2-hydroxyethyl bacteriochlorophyllide A dehydrogenase
MHTDSSLALICSAPNAAGIGRITTTTLGTHDVLIRTLVSGVSSGTDKWMMTGQFTWTSPRFPLVPGYQRSGIVVAVGDDVTSVEVGQLVAATATTGIVDVDAQWGGHAALVASVDTEVFDATGIDPLSSAFLVSAQVGYNAASRVRAEPGAVVLVVGDGIIGASAALACRARGYQPVVVGRHDERLEPLHRSSITTINSRDGDLDDIAAAAPLAAIDTVQSDESFNFYVDVLPPRSGEVVFSGHSPAGTRHWGDMERLQQHELTAHFVSGWAPDRLRNTLELMRRGDMPIDALVGTVASTVSSADRLAHAVMHEPLGPIAVAFDWRSISGV